MIRTLSCKCACNYRSKKTRPIGMLMRKLMFSYRQLVNTCVIITTVICDVKCDYLELTDNSGISSVIITKSHHKSQL
jgi:hypothetical protein